MNKRAMYTKKIDKLVQDAANTPDDIVQLAGVLTQALACLAMNSGADSKSRENLVLLIEPTIRNYMKDLEQYEKQQQATFEA